MARKYYSFKKILAPRGRVLVTRQRWCDIYQSLDANGLYYKAITLTKCQHYQAHCQLRLFNGDWWPVNYYFDADASTVICSSHLNVKLGNSLHLIEVRVKSVYRQLLNILRLEINLFLTNYNSSFTHCGNWIFTKFIINIKINYRILLTRTVHFSVHKHVFRGPTFTFQVFFRTPRHLNCELTRSIHWNFPTYPQPATLFFFLQFPLSDHIRCYRSL